MEKGKFYVSKNTGNICRWGRYDSDYYLGTAIGTATPNTRFEEGEGGFAGSGAFEDLREATADEAGWLALCIEKDRYISYCDYKNQLINMELKITKERILEAASKCPQAKETLKTLFPEVFSQDVSLTPLPGGSGTDFNSRDVAGKDTSIIQVRVGGDYDRRAFWLNTKYKWQLVNEADDYYVLIPTKK